MNRRWSKGQGIFLIGLIVGLLFSVAVGEEKPLPRVVILATGGTIAGRGASSTQTMGYKAAVVPVDLLVESVPELKQVARITAEQIAQIASENMTSAVWLKLAKRVNELLVEDSVDGVVITHGTDTLEETAYFLNLVVKSAKPVVVTGAMRPPTAMSADGPMNLYNSVALAGSPEARGKGVLVVLNDTISSARDVTKTNTMALDTFRSPDLGFLGYISGGKPAFYKKSLRRHTTRSEFDVTKLEELPRVEIVYGFAGSGRAATDAAMTAGVRGIVYAGTGNGSLADEVKKSLADAQAKGAVVVRSSRVGNGIVVRKGEVDDDQYHFIAGDNLNPQKARVLLMLALTKTTDLAEIQRIFWEY